MANSHLSSNSHKEITVEQKLELIRQVRSQYRQNQNDLMHRENILYDRPLRSPVYSDEASPTDVSYYDPHKKGLQTEGTLKIRCLLAVTLTALVIFFHQAQFSPAGISMEQVFLTLEQDYEEIIMSWSSSLIQTEPY